jgi:hypothetical protein
MTTTLIVFDPTVNGIAPDALPLVTETLLTVTVALASDAVGVTVNELTALPTDAEYEVVGAANTGSRVPSLNTRLDRSAFELSTDSIST